ncbi:hypothetical protein ABIB85_005773 [Bradyrhizobium sp. JR1.5]
MEQEATYRGTVYPWQCDHVALRHLAEPAEA